MKTHKNTWEDLCAEWHEDDGIPPKQRHQPQSRKTDYHALQLAKQIRIALTEAFACDCADPLIRKLQVLDVTPHASGSHYLVTLAPASENPETIDRALERIHEARGYLRETIGDAIHRKRIPELKFAIGTEED